MLPTRLQSTRFLHHTRYFSAKWSLQMPGRDLNVRSSPGFSLDLLDIGGGGGDKWRGTKC